MEKTKTRRVKKEIPSMMPVKEWLSAKEACAYLDVSVNTFREIVESHKIGITMVGKSNRYKLSDIKKFLNSNVIVSYK